MSRALILLTAVLLASACTWNGPGTRCALLQNGQTGCVTKDAQNNVIYSGPVGPPPASGYDPTGYFTIRNQREPGLTCTQTGRIIDCEPK